VNVIATGLGGKGGTMTGGGADSPRILWTVSQMATARTSENNFQPKSFMSQSRIAIKN
jgi:hypothetical protein